MFVRLSSGLGQLPQPDCLHFYQNAFPLLSTHLPWRLGRGFQACPDVHQTLVQHCRDEAFPFPKQRSKEAWTLTPERTLLSFSTF